MFRGNQTPMEVCEPSAEEPCIVPPVREFINRYYRTLTDTPQDAWRFYSVGAQHTLADGWGPKEADDPGPAILFNAIHANIAHQRFAECQFRIRSISEQIVDGRILVLVTGHTSRSRLPNLTELFTQTFVLEYVVSNNRYSITNSILKVFTSSPYSR